MRVLTLTETNLVAGGCNAHNGWGMAINSGAGHALMLRFANPSRIL